MNQAREASSRALVYSALVVGVLVGIEAMLSLFFLVPVPSSATIVTALTDYGKDMIRPERDTPVYLAGCLASIVLGLGLAGFWKWRLRQVDEASRADLEWQTAGSLGLIALGSILIDLPILFLVKSRYQPTGLSVGLSVAVVLPVLLTLLAALVAPRFGVFGKWAAVVLPRFVRDDQEQEPEPVTGGRLGSWIGHAAWVLSVSLIIIAILYVPSYRELTGRFVEDVSTPFHHWDFFVMGPALGYSHGGKLGTDVYTQYGVGYPMVVTWLAPLLPLSYSNLTFLSVLYVIVYFIGLAVCLRIALHDRIWALTGVLLAINLQVFRGVYPDLTYWGYPSSTVLRYPMDVWFFLSILLHLRTGQWIWAVTAGIASGLGFLFITDSGLFLITILLFYLVVWSGHEWNSGRRPAPIFATVLAALASVFLTIVAGLLAASRESVFERGDLPALFEAVLSYSNGMGSSPMSSSIGLGNLLLFSFACLVGLTTFSLLCFRLVRREARLDLIFAGSVAAYSMEILLQYVNRSVGMNLYHVIIPFCVLLVGYAARASGAPGPGASRWLSRTVPLGLVVASILLNPLFREYPGLIRTAIKGPLPRGLCLFDDVCGLPEYRSDFIRDVQKVAGRMTELHQSGQSVLVLDSADTMFYLMAGIKPQDRYSPMVINLATRDQLQRAIQRVTDSQADFIVLGKFSYVTIAGQNDYYGTLREARSGFSAIVERDYVLTEHIGPYSLWRSRRLGGSPGPTEARGGRSSPVESPYE